MTEPDISSHHIFVISPTSKGAPQEPTDPWEEVPDWAMGGPGGPAATPLSLAAVESCRIRGESFSAQVRKGENCWTLLEAGAQL